MSFLINPYAFLAAGGDYVPLASVTVGSGGASSIEFTSIPGTYQHLQVRGIAQAVSTSRLGIGFNADTTMANYNSHFLYGTGASAAAGYGSNLWSLTAAAVNTSMFGAFVCDILDYADTSKYTVWRSTGGYDNNGSGLAITYSGLWRSTAAVSSIRIYGSETGTSGTVTQYSTFALYGIKGA